YIRTARDSQCDEVCFATRMLHGAVEKHVISYQVLPTVAMAVECCVILCDHVAGLCRHGCIDHALLLAPSVPPAGGPSSWGHAHNPRIRGRSRAYCSSPSACVANVLMAEWLCVRGMADCNCGGEPPTYRS